MDLESSRLFVHKYFSFIFIQKFLVGKVAPYKNFILCFDPMVWLGVLVSLTAMSLAVATAVKVGLVSVLKSRKIHYFVIFFLLF